jgi:multidrug efflux pump subunit AcrB
MFVAGETEARPGVMTTEFWLTILAAMTVVIAAYISDSFETNVGWALFAGIIAAYLLSRGLAKAGSREGPFVIGGEARDDR